AANRRHRRFRQCPNRRRGRPRQLATPRSRRLSSGTQAQGRPIMTELAATLDRSSTELDLVVLDNLPESDRTLLVVDDAGPLCTRLARAMERRGFIVETAESVAQGVAAADARPPAFAVVDLRLGDGSGLDVVGAL